MYSIDKEQFSKNLLLTQAYCEPMNKGENIASTLRSFNPEYNGQPLFSYKFVTNWNFEDCYITLWNIDLLLNRNENFYNELFEKQLQYKIEKIGNSNKSVEYEGRVLLAEIDMTVVDGTSEAISQGFIDNYDCPPIDTWFYKIIKEEHRILFAWVPNQFVDLVDEAIAINCVDCLKWYDEKKVKWLK